MIDRYLSSECPVREISTISKIQKCIYANNESNKDSECKSYSSTPEKYIHETCIWPTQEGSSMFEENECKYPLKIISSTIEIMSEREVIKKTDCRQNYHKTQSTHINEIEFWYEFSLVVLPSYEGCDESKKEFFDEIHPRDMEYIPKKDPRKYTPWEKSNKDCKNFIKNGKLSEWEVSLRIFGHIFWK